MKSTFVKTAAAIALMGTSIVAYAASSDCCMSLECCLKMLGCCS